MDAIRDDTILTAAEVASYLKLDRKTVYQLCKEGRLPYRRVGRLVRFSKLAVEAWVREGEAPTRRFGR
ncbi:MAG: helix-turn-helix domain-containing protein [Bacillota bacterium]